MQPFDQPSKNHQFSKTVGMVPRRWLSFTGSAFVTMTGSVVGSNLPVWADDLTSRQGAAAATTAAFLTPNSPSLDSLIDLEENGPPLFLSTRWDASLSLNALSPTAEEQSGSGSVSSDTGSGIDAGSGTGAPDPSPALVASDDRNASASVLEVSSESANSESLDNTTPTPVRPDDSLEAQAEPSQSAPEAEPAASGGWEFTVEPYLLVPLEVNADITVRGRTATVEAGLSDVLNLDRIFAGALRLEARKQRFGIIVDGSYLSAGKDGRLDVTIPTEFVERFGINSDVNASADASVDARQGVLDIAASYRVVDQFLGRDGVAESYPRLLVEPILGVRMNWLSQEAEISSVRVAGIALPDQDIEFSAFFAEPMVGGAIGLELSDRWALGLRGDISGFDINADRNLSWNLFLGSQYRLSRSVALQLAYRFNKFDYQDGEGTDRLGLNLRQQQIVLGLKFSF
jgi:opacity protein-like surface antigen